MNRFCERSGDGPRDCLPPNPAPPGPGCLQLQRPAATGHRWVLSSHPVVWRLVAHREVRGVLRRYALPLTLTVGRTRMSAPKTSSATTTRSAGSSSAAVHDISVVLPAPGLPANTIESRACTQAGSRRSDLVQWGMLTARVAAFLRDADELADVHEDMPDAGHVAVDDVDAGAVVELGVIGRQPDPACGGHWTRRRAAWSGSAAGGRRRGRPRPGIPMAPRAVLRDDGPARLVLRATFKLANVRRTS